MTPERFRQLESLIRRIRQRIFDYYDESPEKGEKASRVLSTAMARAAAYRRSLPVERGAYSGLTRAELRATGTCETDWF